MIFNANIFIAERKVGMKRKFFSFAVLILIAAMLFCSCAKSESFADNSFIADRETPGESNENYEEGVDDALLDKTAGAETTDRKIIMRYSFTVETKDLDATVKSLEDAVKARGGYYERASVYGNTEDGGNADLVLRIPSNQAESLNEEIAKLGNVTYQTKSGDDVTTAYYDTENKLNSLKIQQERLLALLEKAESLDDILKLETELTRVRTEIESLTTVLVKYDNLIDYTTINVTLRQVRTYTEPEPETFGTKIANAFKSSIETTKEVFQGIVIAVVWLAPLLVIMTVAVVVIVFALKGRKKRAKTSIDKNNSTEE